MNNEYYREADNFNRMFNESSSKGYQAQYTRLNNDKYGSNKKKKTSGLQLITTLIVGGVIGYYTYKNVLKPASQTILKLKSMFDNMGPDNTNRTNNHVFRENDRVFDGHIRPLSQRELRELERDYQNTIYCEYSVRDIN